MLSYATNNSYQDIQVSTGAGIVDADPHRLIQMLYQGLLDKLAKAKGHIARKQIDERNQTINRCIDIIDYLRVCLDHDVSQTLTRNLESLYLYMIERLYHANINNDATAIDEVAKLVLTVKSGWDQIPPQERQRKPLPQAQG